MRVFRKGCLYNVYDKTAGEYFPEFYYFQNERKDGILVFRKPDTKEKLYLHKSLIEKGFYEVK